MKLKEGFILRKIAGEHVLIPTGSENIQNYNGLITLNGSAAYLCTLLREEQTRESLTRGLLDRYEVSEEVAAADVDRLLSAMREHRMLEEGK